MPRYILIDSNSGYIWGDTGDLNGPARDEPALEAAKRLDESLGEFGRFYEEHGPNYRLNGAGGYHVYRADVRGSEVVPLVEDGQNQETVDAVTQHCDAVAVVSFTGTSL